MNTKKIILSQTFDATPEELWDAWTDPTQFAKWFNPVPGYDLIIHEFDVRVGGHYKYDIPQPDGNLNTQEGIFHVLNPFEEITYGSRDKSYLIKALFKKEDSKTKIIVELTGVPPEYQAGAPQYWHTLFIQLDNLLEKKLVLRKI